MAKSRYVLRLDEVQAGINALLKPLGFRKRGRTFNRTTEEDLVQVVALQAGPFEIGAGTYGQPSYYGKFSANLGIHIKEVYDRMNPGHTPRTISDAHCTVRSRLSWLDSGEDHWWSLEESADELIDEVGGLLLAVGVPFLDRFDTRDKVIESFDPADRGHKNYWMPARPDIAMILLKRGDREGAKALLIEQVKARPDHAPHQAYVRELADRLGLGPLGV
jgi:hypothetical protein